MCINDVAICGSVIIILWDVIQIGVYSAAHAYQKLFDYEYQFLIVKNRNTPPIEVNLRFDKSYFHHLCGLHKLKDIEAIRREKRESIFDKILQGRYSDSMFENSIEYSAIRDRVDCLEVLETMLDDDNTVFKFNKSADRHSAIEADFIIKSETVGLRRYYFVSESDEIKGRFFGRSCFSRTTSERDYTKGHTTYTILRKTKVKLSTQEKKDLYIAPSYKQELERSGQDVNHIQKIEFHRLPDITPDGTATIPQSSIHNTFVDILHSIKAAFHSLLQGNSEKKQPKSEEKSASSFKKSISSTKPQKKAQPKTHPQSVQKAEEKQPVAAASAPVKKALFSRAKLSATAQSIKQQSKSAPDKSKVHKKDDPSLIKQADFISIGSKVCMANFL